MGKGLKDAPIDEVIRHLAIAVDIVKRRRMNVDLRSHLEWSQVYAFIEAERQRARKNRK